MLPSTCQQPKIGLFTPTSDKLASMPKPSLCDSADTLRRVKSSKKNTAARLKYSLDLKRRLTRGSDQFVQTLRSEFVPDYIVGSLHHVGDREFDCARDGYFETAESFGGLDSLYCRYFDEQYAMIDTLKPSVIGHFDLVRLFDPAYKS